MWRYVKQMFVKTSTVNLPGEGRTHFVESSFHRTAGPLDKSNLQSLAIPRALYTWRVEDLVTFWPWELVITLIHVFATTAAGRTAKSWKWKTQIKPRRNTSNWSIEVKSKIYIGIKRAQMKEALLTWIKDRKRGTPWKCTISASRAGFRVKPGKLKQWLWKHGTLQGRYQQLLQNTAMQCLPHWLPHLSYSVIFWHILSPCSVLLMTFCAFLILRCWFCGLLVYLLQTCLSGIFPVFPFVDSILVHYLLFHVIPCYYILFSYSSSSQ